MPALLEIHLSNVDFVEITPAPAWASPKALGDINMLGIFFYQCFEGPFTSSALADFTDTNLSSVDRTTIQEIHHNNQQRWFQGEKPIFFRFDLPGDSDQPVDPAVEDAAEARCANSPFWQPDGNWMVKVRSLYNCVAAIEVDMVKISGMNGIKGYGGEGTDLSSYLDTALNHVKEVKALISDFIMKHP